MSSYNLDDSVRAWRYAVLSPGAAEGHALKNLAGALMGPTALFELQESRISLEDLAADLAINPDLTTRQTFRPAFARAEERCGGTVHLLLVLDQLEELWTDRSTTAEDRELFLGAIETVARCGRVWVLATLRSDFYPQAQQSNAFLRLKARAASTDLRPPSPAALARVIAEPARLAGLRFERDEASGRTLDQLVLEDALRQPEALPLLQYTLRELYEGCTVGGLLSFAAYTSLGGVEGALGRRAESVFAALPDDARAVFGDVFHALVTVDAFGEGGGLRRRAPLAVLTAAPAQRTLVDTLILHRFLTADRAGDVPVATLAHEALIRRWARLADWLGANREHLRLRARVEQSQARWELESRDPSLLLPAGLPLAEGRTLLLSAPRLLSGENTQFIQASLAHHEAVKTRRVRVRRAVIGALSTLLVLISALAATSIMQRRSANAVQHEKLQTEAALEKVKELSALMTLKTGVSLYEQGDGGRGMLWMSRSLAICPASEPNLQRAIRTALVFDGGDTAYPGIRVSGLWSIGPRQLQSRRQDPPVRRQGHTPDRCGHCPAPKRSTARRPPNFGRGFQPRRQALRHLNHGGRDPRLRCFHRGRRGTGYHT